MFLKHYQVKVVSELKTFFSQARETKDTFDKAKASLPPEMRHTLNWVQTAFQKTSKFYQDKPDNGLGEYYPRLVMKVPTGGGKTLLAVEAIREYQTLFARRRTGLVVWIVPSETIYSQTVNKLRDKANPLRQLLDQASGNKTLIIEKGQRLTTQDIDENLVILFVMIQSISRQNGKEALKVFQDSGGFESFFPADNRYDLHGELKKLCPNLDLLSELGPIIKTSLGNAIRLSKPFIIIDEMHKVFSDMARKTIDGLNPEMVLGLTATPKSEMNILVSISGLELKDEEMVKLNMHIIPPSSPVADDWKVMLKEIKAHRDRLEKQANTYKQDSGIYIRPIALIQVERTGKEQRGKGFVHSLDVKEYLQDLGINPDEIAIKSSSQNDIEDVNLFGQDCIVRYIITKEALREGWDCSFAYMLGIIPNVNSDTGITQLVGRILRQPYARKTGIRELDESYVYYSRGDTRSMLEKVDAGFKNEGLEDLINQVKVQNNNAINPAKTVRIRKEYKDKFNHAFYLPVWVMMKARGKQRRFSYEMDIKPYIDYASFTLSSEMIGQLQSSFSRETEERQSIIITLDAQSRVKTEYESVQADRGQAINVDYLTRRYVELMENPFYACKLAEGHVAILIKQLGQKTVEDNFGYITAFLYKQLQDYKAKSEEKLFMKYVEAKAVVLAVSNDPVLGYKIPEEDSIVAGRFPNTYTNYLFDDVDIASMNTLEKKVGDILDKQDKILWWFRNKVSKKWYSIQGWQEYKIRPDFIAAKKNDNGHLELVYVLESKGEHLLGNANTHYKQNVMTTMTNLKKMKGMVMAGQKEFEFGGLNDQVECYLIEEGKEEEDIRKLYK